MKRQIDKQELERRLKGYFQRMKGKDVPKIPLNEKGLYRIVSGEDIEPYGKRHTLKIVNGRFIDAVSYAVQLPGFPGDWCSWTYPDNCNHGYLEKINPVKLPLNKGLNYLRIFNKPKEKIK